MTAPKIKWFDRGRPPQSPPNPDYPNGVDIDMSGGAMVCCVFDIPYPSGHTNIGSWVIECGRCHKTVIVTAASRPDDPKSVKVACP